MSDAPKKCAHEACTCQVSGHDKYCSQMCEDSHKYTSFKCDCKHPACAGEEL